MGAQVNLQARIFDAGCFRLCETRKLDCACPHCHHQLHLLLGILSNYTIRQQLSKVRQDGRAHLQCDQRIRPAQRSPSEVGASLPKQLHGRSGNPLPRASHEAPLIKAKVSVPSESHWIDLHNDQRQDQLAIFHAKRQQYKQR